MLTTRPFIGDRLSLMSFTAPATVDAIRPGDIAVVRLRAFGSDPVNANHCTGCTLRNITVYSTASGGAAVGMISSRSSVLERVYLMPKPGTDRLISATSAIYVGVGGLGTQIRLSRGIRTTDDAFWFYGRVVGSVQSQPIAPASSSRRPQVLRCSATATLYRTARPSHSSGRRTASSSHPRRLCRRARRRRPRRKSRTSSTAFFREPSSARSCIRLTSLSTARIRSSSGVRSRTKARAAVECM